ncbi:unnamed protein product [Linum trigynum]|uniref:Secreted protein n=1 Tax=Linum trigynum TaxID=586398 RepID=A0AAV2G0F2_9ROSI
MALFYFSPFSIFSLSLLGLHFSACILLPVNLHTLRPVKPPILVFDGGRVTLSRTSNLPSILFISLLLDRIRLFEIFSGVRSYSLGS